MSAKELICLSSPQNTAADGHEHKPQQDAQKNGADPGPQQYSNAQSDHTEAMQISFSTHAKNTPCTVYAGGVQHMEKF